MLTLRELEIFTEKTSSSEVPAQAAAELQYAEHLRCAMKVLYCSTGCSALHSTKHDCGISRLLA